MIDKCDNFDSWYYKPANLYVGGGILEQVTKVNYIDKAMTREEIKYLLFLETFCPEDEDKRPSEDVYKKAKKLLDEGCPLGMIFECLDDSYVGKQELINLAEALEKQYDRLLEGFLTEPPLDKELEQ
jgi:hypothetical protein